MIDFHAHILPNADHGSKNIETSFKQVSLARRAGISTIVATPHFYMNSDTLEDFIKRRDESYNELIEALRGTALEDIRIIKASEVNLQVDLFQLKDLKPLCIENTNYMLLELAQNIPEVPEESFHLQHIQKLLCNELMILQP